MDEVIDYHCFLIYTEGKLYWKERSFSFFKTDRDCTRWNNRYAGKEAGSYKRSTKRSTNYIELSILGKRFLAHRIVWEMFNGPIPEGMEIDHIDGNGYNNILSNLRLVTSTQNMRNRKKPSSNTSGTIGVCWIEKRKKWCAQITLNYKVKHLGYFDLLEDAVEARAKAEKQNSFHINHGR